MSQIFKVHHLNKNKIEKTYIFSDKDKLDTDIMDKLSNFTHVKKNIYGDDTIITVKHKISRIFNNQSINEVFLFTTKKQILTHDNIYNKLTQNNNIINKTNIKHFLSNIVKKRQILANNYDQLFKNLKDVSTPLKFKNKKNAYHLYPIRINFRKIKRAHLCARFFYSVFAKSIILFVEIKTRQNNHALQMLFLKLFFLG